jgi:hypothetical protein
VILDKFLAQPLAVTITLTPKDAEFLRDHTFWTRESPEQLLARLCAAYTEPNGKGEDHLWDIARDPMTRAVAFKRNKLSTSKTASLNQSLDATFEKLRRTWERETGKVIKSYGRKYVVKCAGRIIATFGSFEEAASRAYQLNRMRLLESPLPTHRVLREKGYKETHGEARPLRVV